MKIHQQDGGGNYATRFQQTLSCDKCRWNNSEESLTYLYAYSCGVISAFFTDLHARQLGLNTEHKIYLQKL